MNWSNQELDPTIMALLDFCIILSTELCKQETSQQRPFHENKGHLELLGLPNPDHNSAVVSVAWATQKGNLLLLGQVLRVLGVEDGVVNALCKEPGQSDVKRGAHYKHLASQLQDLDSRSNYR